MTRIDSKSYLTRYEFDQIKKDLKVHQQLARSFEKNEFYGINFLGYKMRFDVVTIKNIGDKINSLYPCRKRATLAGIV